MNVKEAIDMKILVNNMSRGKNRKKMVNRERKIEIV